LLFETQRRFDYLTFWNFHINILSINAYLLYNYAAMWAVDDGSFMFGGYLWHLEGLAPNPLVLATE